VDSIKKEQSRIANACAMTRVGVANRNFISANPVAGGEKDAKLMSKTT